MKIAVILIQALTWAALASSGSSGSSGPLLDDHNVGSSASPLKHDRKDFNQKLLAHRRLILAVQPTVTKSLTPNCVEQAGSDLDAALPEEFTVTIDVQGSGSTTQLTVPVHVVFALDSSSSMQRTDPLDLRIEASLQFVDKLSASRGDRAGVVSWDRNVDLSLPLTSNFQSVKNALNEVDDCCGTKLDVGLEEAVDIMGERDPTISQVIIFLTDGQGSYTRCEEEGPAKEASQKGFVIFGVALSDEAYDLPLVDMAVCTGGTFTDAQTAAELVAIFSDIFDTIEESTVPFNIDVKEIVEPYVNVVSASGGGSVTSLPDGTTQILWSNIDGGSGLSSSDPVKQFTYRATTSRGGQNLPISVDDSQVSFTDLTGAIRDFANTPIVTANVNGSPNAVCQDASKNIDCTTEQACFNGADVNGGSTGYVCPAGTSDLEVVRLIPDDPACFGPGGHTVTLEVTSTNGLVSQCTATVFVRDPTECGPPTPQTPPPTRSPATQAPNKSPPSPTPPPTPPTDSFDAPALVPFVLPIAPAIAPAIAPFVSNLPPNIFNNGNACDENGQCRFLSFLPGTLIHLNFFGLFCFNFCAPFLASFKVNYLGFRCGRCP